MQTGSIISIELDLQGSKYGKPGKFTKTNSRLPFLSFGATSTTELPQNWQSVSGSYSTTAKGKSGTIDVALTQTNGKRGRLIIKGSWQDCKIGGNL